MGGSVRGERKWRRARWSEDRASADDARSTGVGAVGARGTKVAARAIERVSARTRRGVKDQRGTKGVGGSVRGERKWRRARWSEDRASADDARSAGVGGSVCRERKETY